MDARFLITIVCDETRMWSGYKVPIIPRIGEKVSIGTSSYRVWDVEYYYNEHSEFIEVTVYTNLID